MSPHTVVKFTTWKTTYFLVKNHNRQPVKMPKSQECKEKQMASCIYLPVNDRHISFEMPWAAGLFTNGIILF